MDGDGWSRLGGLPRGGDGSKGIQYKGIFWLAWVEWRPWGTQRVSPSIVPSCVSTATEDNCQSCCPTHLGKPRGWFAGGGSAGIPRTMLGMSEVGDV